MKNKWEQLLKDPDIRAIADRQFERGYEQGVEDTNRALKNWPGILAALKLIKREDLDDTTTKTPNDV